MIASLTTPQLYAALEITPPSHNIMLVGKHGIGKSQIVTDYFSRQGMRVTTLFLGQMSDPGDLIGLPRINSETGKTEFVPPYWFPTDGKPMVLFLDELNRARPEMLQSVMDLVLNRQLAGRRLPEGSRIVSAVNDGEEYNVDELDPALLSRFNIYEFRPTVGEWCEWARTRKLDKRVVDFIERNPSALDGGFSANAESFTRFPDRRAWHRVADIMGAVKRPNALTFKIVAGIVGARAAAKFSESLIHESLSSSDILYDFDNRSDDLHSLTIVEMSNINEGIFRIIDAGKYDRDKEQVVILNLMNYIAWLGEQHHDEALAHFIGIFTGGAYPKANEFIVSKCPSLYRQFTTFVHNIRK